MCFTRMYMYILLKSSVRPFTEEISEVKQPAQLIYLKSVVLFEPRDAKRYVYHIEPTSLVITDCFKWSNDWMVHSPVLMYLICVYSILFFMKYYHINLAISVMKS